MSEEVRENRKRRSLLGTEGSGKSFNYLSISGDLVLKIWSMQDGMLVSALQGRRKF